MVLKHPRKKGFLTPTLEFTVGGDQGIITPYYLSNKPIIQIFYSNQKFSFNQNFEFLEKYQLNQID